MRNEIMGIIKEIEKQINEIETTRQDNIQARDEMIREAQEYYWDSQENVQHELEILFGLRNEFCNLIQQAEGEDGEWIREQVGYVDDLVGQALPSLGLKI